MMPSFYEKRPLKKPRIGPPDVYPQEPKQKEDELTSLNVKHGFATMPQLSDEFGTARNCNVTASKVGAYFNSILAKKEELCTLQDSGRKRQQINTKDNFWPAIVRNKHCIEAWFKDLASNKPLMVLAKRAPIFNKKEEIFMMLSEYQVPMLRAAWLIKLSSAYTVAVSEAKNKKRQLPDPTTEWTGTLIKFLKDQIPKLSEYYHQNSSSFSSSGSTVNGAFETKALTPQSTSGTISTSTPSTNSISGLTAPPLHSPAQTSIISPPTESDFKVANRQWTYCIQLAKYMYEEGLLDRQEVLNWVLELIDRMRSQPADDGILRLFLPLVLQYLDEFVQSELLSRRLAYLCAKKLTYMLNSIAENNLNLSLTQVESIKTENSSGTDKDKKEIVPAAPTSLQATISEYFNCPHHKEILLQLSCILQVITLECPIAMVWCGIGENRSNSVWHGSPLDVLPVPPSQLPLPSRTATGGIPANGAYANDLRMRLRHSENQIRSRSRRAEGRWCAEKWQASSAGMAITKVLAALDALDRHRFDRVDTNNSLDTLYAKIFPPPGTKDVSSSIQVPSGQNSESKETKIEYNMSQDEPLVQILCEWAVSHERWGEHRAMAVAWLLDKRQSDITSLDSESNGNDDKDSVSSLNNQQGSLPIFQPFLMKFLDNDAPILEENGTPQNRAMFTNLVHLFAELVRHDVFSHDAYMCTLISRGDLISGGPNGVHRPPTPPANPSLDDDMMDLKPIKLDGLDDVRGMDYDDSKIDDDLDKILQHIKEDQQNSMDAADSPKDPDHHHTNISSNISILVENDHNDMRVRPSRHLLYTTHFPLPQDETFSQHDCNQRHVLLYGVGKVRDEARHTVKKMAKEICKLFSKKFSIDVAEGGKVKKHSRNEFNFESTTQKCQSLSYFDQHVVTWQCSVNVIEMLNSFASGNSNYLPVQEHVAFLFDLMELALNIYGLIDVCISILKELPEVETQLLAKNSNLARNYTTSLSLYVVGVLRRYHCCLLLSADQTWQVFDGLCKVVKHVTTPGDCSSADRCVLAHLYDLYSSCNFLKAKPHTEFANAYPKIRQALYSALQPSGLNNYVYNAHCMQEVFQSPRRGGKIETNLVRQLAESPNNRYSFVTNAIIAVCRETDNERLNEISITCAEVTACCNSLSAEWVGALMALCCSTNSSNYIDLLAQVDVQDFSIHNSLAVFTSILIARHCFSLEDFVKHIALPNLVKVSKAFSEFRSDSLMTPAGNVEAGARLTCHLLLRLFKTVECPQPGLYSVSTSPQPLPAGQQNGYSIRLSCDRHLLAAAHNNIKVGPVLAVLKAILVVGDATAREGKDGSKRDGNSSSVHSGMSSGNKSQVLVIGELTISHILGTSDIKEFSWANHPEEESSWNSQRQSNSSEGNAALSAFAWHVLREICSQQWVLERCLSQPEELFQSDMLLDSMLTSSQAQRLLHMICYPDLNTSLDELDQKAIITRILENLDQWTLRMSWLDLQLMFKQFNANSSELNQWLDTVAKAAIDVFQLNSLDPMTDRASINKYENKYKSGSIWLVAPLVSKLPSAVQGRVLKVAGQVLETNNWPTIGKRAAAEAKEAGPRVSKRSSYSTLLSHQPFLSLVLTCLKGQDDQRESLLTSLHTQLSQFLTLNKDERIGTCEIGSRESMLDALQLRFSLVGGMFDTVQRSMATTTDWAVLLVQLISYGIIDLSNNSELFTTVIDMLATLVHSTLVSDSQCEKDENKKHYQNLMKKLKKELGDRHSPSIQHVRQLLQLPKKLNEIIACDSVGCLTDTKGNKITGFDSIDKKQGLRVSDKQRVSPWDLLEGQKSPAPLSWSWYGAVRIERKPLWYEDTHRLLKYHTHSLLRPASHYLDPVPLPPEDLEPIQEKPLKDCDLKADTPSSVDQSPRSAALGKVRGKTQRRSRKAKAMVPCPNLPTGPGQMSAAGPPGQPMQVGQPPQGIPNQTHQPNMNMAMAGMQAPQQQMGHMGGYGGQMGAGAGQQGYPNTQGPQQWGYNPQQQAQQQPQNPQGYYGQQMPGVSRYERPQINQSKQALSNMLRQRHPLNQYMGQAGVNAPQGPATAGGVTNNYAGMQRQFPRQQMRGPQQPHPGSTMQANPNMFQQQYGNMQQTMNQNYGSYGNQQMAANPNAQQTQMMQGNAGNVGSQQAMMSGFQNQQSGFGASQVGPGGGMMGQRSAAQTDYLAQQQRMGQPSRPQYLQAPNVTMNTMGPLSGVGGAQGGPAPPYSRTAGGGKPGIQANQQSQQFQQQQRIRQQMMAMQQQQQQQQAGGQPGAAGGQPSALVAHLQRQMQQPPNQHNPYQHQPPAY